MTKLVHITLASEEVELSRAFYSGLFQTEFDAVEVGDATLYRGSAAGLGMVICPTEMADVVANRSRHQLQFELDDVEAAVMRATASGGTIHTPLVDANGRNYAVVCDPDNNTIELVG